MRVADFVTQTVKKYSDTIYMVTGGGAMHLNDAFGRCGINIVFCHHEQACSIAAEAHARVSNKIQFINVTTGPGGINALNGVFGAWTDSIPMLVISGQVKRETTISHYGENGGWRQLGDQEADIIPIVKNITKYAVSVVDANEISYHLEKAIYLAQNGRPGPCWIDIPLDIQAMLIDETNLKQFIPESKTPLQFESEFNNLIQLIRNAKKPVLYLGAGVHLSGMKNQVIELAELLNIPIVTTFNSHDLIPDEHPLYVGRPGTIGNRAGNFVAQNSDLVIVLGSRLNIRLVSYNWKSFAPRAVKVGIDIDEKELNKPTCTFDLKFIMDLKDFIPRLKDLAIKKELHSSLNFKEWISWSKKKLYQYPVCLPEYWKKTAKVNPYCFVDELSDQTDEGELIVCANGTACVTTFQGIKVKKDQRIFHNSGCASMGYDLPAAIGTFYANPKAKRIICLAGDGSIMMNLQELQTIAGYNLPIQIFILNNQGYHSIRQTQHNFFKDNIVGCGTESGLTFPDFEKVATAFHFPYFRIENHKELKENLGTIMKTKGRFICEIELDLEQQFSPKLSSKKLDDGTMVSPSLEDMWPFLSPEESKENMIC
jgi:acetolactate synthase-1/2/3 large subunit